MTIEEFISARLAEAFNTPPYSHRTNDMIEVFRKILEHHKNWPVLVETPMEVVDSFKDYDPLDGDKLYLQMSKRLEFFTQQEYIKRFGTEPPTAPILKMIAMMWCTHPDFNNDWIIE